MVLRALVRPIEQGVGKVGPSPREEEGGEEEEEGDDVECDLEQCMWRKGREGRGEREGEREGREVYVERDRERDRGMGEGVPVCYA